jgi:hypothetical protein
MTAGVQPVRIAVETFGRDHVRGRAFDKLSRAETRPQLAQHLLVSGGVASGKWLGLDRQSIDLLAESAVSQANRNDALPNRPVNSRVKALDIFWANWD